MIAETEGPWSRAKGNEVGVNVVHLMEGERVVVEMEGRFQHAVRKLFDYNEPGSFPLNFYGCDRYRVCKRVHGTGSAPTTVEIILNGNAPS
jgi:hypothetical protein